LVLLKRISFRYRNLGYHPICAEASLNLLLRRNEDFDVALDYRLAGKGIPLLDILGSKPQSTAATNVAVANPHHASTTSPLPAARLDDFNSSLLRGFG
jgi:hypothetical protein